MMIIKKVSQPYYDLIKNGSKTIEGRLLKDDWGRIMSGNKIIWTNPDSEGFIQTIVTDIYLFNSFEEMLKDGDNLHKTLPNVNTIEEGINIYNNIYGNLQHNHKVCAFVLKLV